MGLDMYMSGEKFFTSQERKLDEEGYKIAEIHLELGYWRKHANLHGYIVEKHGPKDPDTGRSIDNCEPITLSLDDLKALLDVVRKPSMMPKTDGFFFGTSDNDDDQIKDDVAIIERAIAFLASPGITGEKNVWRSVVYRASW